MTPPDAALPALKTEAVLFARYLTGRPPTADVAARYLQACGRIFPAPPAGRDAAVLRFATRRPWSIGPLEAACGLTDPSASLRGRLLLMLALLETDPSSVEAFLPAPRPRLALLASLAGQGLAAAAKVAVGLPLLLLARAGR